MALPMHPSTPQEDRPLLQSVLRGWARRCPNCGKAPLLEGYLKVRDHCGNCGEAFHHHRADDMPAWATILIVGHLLAGSILTAEQTWQPPIWVHFTLWPALGAAISLFLLPRLKGAVVGMQWANRMHGFDHPNGPARSLD